MVDSCYICRRTQTDLDHLNEEIRTRVYLSYFSNARGFIDEQQRRIAFLQRLRDEESGDPHFRINAKQVFGDPPAYKKLMPWIDTLIEIVSLTEYPVSESATIGALVEQLLEVEHQSILKREQGLNELRSAFASGGKPPLSLEAITPAFPVDWNLSEIPFKWRATSPSERELLHRAPGGSKSTVDVPIFLCTICRTLVRPT